MDDLGYFGPDSVSWRVMGDATSIVGGLRALLVQALHPEAVEKLHAVSRFADRPWERLRNTGEFLGTLTFGSRAEADAAAARVRRIHRAVGVDEPHLLRWIHVTEVDSFLRVAQLAGVVRGRTDADRFVAEQVRAGELIGLDRADLPVSTADVRAYLASMRGTLRLTAHARRGARVILAPPMPWRVELFTPARIGWTALSSMAVGSLPSWARRRYLMPPGVGTLGTAAGLRTLRGAAAVLPDSVARSPHARAGWARAEALSA